MLNRGIEVNGVFGFEQEFFAANLQGEGSLDQKEKFDRLFLVGSQETMVQIESALTAPLAAKLAGKQNVDWLDPDSLIVDREWVPGEVTAAPSPRGPARPGGRGRRGPTPAARRDRG